MYRYEKEAIIICDIVIY